MLGRPSRSTPLGFALASTLVLAIALAGCASRSDDAPARDAPAPAPTAAASPAPKAPSAAPSPAAPEPVPPAVPEPAPLPAPELPALPALPVDLSTAILAGVFEHPSIEIPAGSTITWTNADRETHSVVSTDGTFSGSGPISPGMSFQRTFQTPGTFAFHCRYHDGMTGTVVVQ